MREKYDYTVLDSKVGDDDKFSFAVTVRGISRYDGKILAFNDFKIDEDKDGEMFIESQMLIINAEDKTQIEFEDEDREFMERFLNSMLSELIEKQVESTS